MNLKQLAEHLGLSQTTVSRALNGYPEVGEETRKRVAEAARMQGYHPNSNARRLALGRTGTIGLTLPLGRGLSIDPLFAEFLGGLASKIAESDSDLLIIPVKSEPEPIPRASHLRSVDAVIISAPGKDDPLVAQVRALKVPFVLHGRTNSSDPYAYLDIDNEGAFHRATDLLIDLGHSRIGLVNANPWLNFAADREIGWRAALAARGFAAPDAYIRSGTLTEEASYRFAHEMLSLAEPPTAFLCSSMLSALGIGRAIADLGLVVGADVSLIAHDDGLPSIRPTTMVPPLTTTFSSLRKAGEHIETMARALGNGADIAGHQEVWPVDIVFRGSAQRSRARKA
ncbi:MAG: substrate-binding domain-containing protein [Ancalomicrobiaceae bacterium]|nr:substrate-binding domain-containing protein [Ancalomicrobiaceae bacterium]